MFKNAILMLFLSLLVGVFIDFPTACLVLVTYFIFNLLIQIWNRKNYSLSGKVYGAIFICNLAYALACYIYMKSNNFKYLITFDTIDAFLPKTKSFLAESRNYFKIVSLIFSDYKFFDRFQAGYYTFLTFWGSISREIGSDLYFTLQLGSFATCSLGGVFLYKILKINEIEDIKSYKYALIISLFSNLFIFDSFIIRDGLIALLFIYIIYLMHHDITFQIILKFILSIFIMTTLRIETGLFAIIFFPTYLFIYNKSGSIRNVVIYVMSIIVLSIIFIWGFKNYNSLFQLFEDNKSSYTDTVKVGSGTIGMLQRLPPIISDFLSSIYTAIQPFPFWIILVNPYGPLNRPECYNIMGFPFSIAVIFNFYIIFYLTVALFQKYNKKTTTSLRHLYIILIPVFAYLFVQSAVVDPRRVMGVYVVFYLLWAIIHKSASKKFNKKIRIYTMLSFSILQITSMIIFYLR